MSSQRTTPLPPGPPFDSSSSSPPPPPPPKPSRTSARPSNSNPAHSAHNANLAALSPPPPPPLPPPPNSSSTTDPRSDKAHEESPKNAHQPLPPDPAEHWLPEILLDKPTHALSPLLAAPNLLTALTSTHPSLRPSPLPPHLAATAALAAHVLASYERLLQLRHATQQHLLQQHGLERAWRAQQQRMDGVLEPWSAKALYRRLGAAERDAEEVSRGLEEEFLDGGGGGGTGGAGGGAGDGKATERELAEFCRRYREARGVVGRRREWRQRWDEGRVGGWR